MTKMYKGTKGKIAGIVSFLEEILPLDIIPTFTIMWIYTYVIQKETIETNENNKTEKKTIIDV